MKTDFFLAFNEMVEEKQLSREVVTKALESAMVSAYRKAVTASAAQHVEAVLNLEEGKFQIYAEKEVVDSVVDDRTEVSLETARQFNPAAEYGDLVIVESTPEDFGRIAAQTARQVIQQRLRDAERAEQIGYYEKKVGEIVSGVVQSINRDGYTIGLDKKAEGTLLKKDVIRDEERSIQLHKHIRAIITEVKDSPRGPLILLSRVDRKFLYRLLEIDVPEIFHGIVEVRSIAREPGARAKIAVSATQAGIDPVGACVGMQGKRIQPIVKELCGEKIDVIEWNPDPALFIAKAISPAKVIGVYLSGGRNTTVVVPDDQLSLAIGKDGQNARLAAKLTNWRIDIKSVSEAAADILAAYDAQEDYTIPDPEQDKRVVMLAWDSYFVEGKETPDEIRAILQKKSDGHPLNFEEDEKLNRFVDRVEKAKTAGFNESTVRETVRKLYQSGKPSDELMALPVSEVGLPNFVVSVLRYNGFKTVEDLYKSVKADPEEIFKLQGTTPSVMDDIASLVRLVEDRRNAEANPAPVQEEAAEPEAPAADSEREADEPAPAAESGEAAEDLAAETTVTAPASESAAESEPEEDVSFDDLFKLIPVASEIDYSEDFGEVSGDSDRKKKKKGRRKNTEIEYDPDSDSTVVRKKHRRGDEDWGW
ncbi:transcription termination factor NusA [Anaerolineaceae bacterium oral taxon 439]|nr:transcription termination factor NusA [Anaerolineaceae bacterium oral taxon 439]